MKLKEIDYHWQISYQDYHIECSPAKQMEKLRIKYTHFEVHGHGEFTRFFNCTNLPKFKRMPKYLQIR